MEKLRNRRQSLRRHYPLHRHRGFYLYIGKDASYELTLHLEEYFNFMLEELRLENATVDKFFGDSIMAFWGAPVENAKHATSAVRAVWNCTQKLNEFNKKWHDSENRNL